MKPLLALAVAAVLFVVSCAKNTASHSGNSHLNVYLTDDPSAYSAVNIDIQDVQVHTGADTGENSWQSLHIFQPGVYNLLDFNNGMDTLIASVDLPAGSISQIRLVLGSNNSIVSNGNSYPLTTPSGQQSGLKLNLDVNLEPGVAYGLWIDFDAGRSIVTAGDKYILKPVIRAFTKASSGAITGFVLPAAANATVYAIAPGNDTVSSTFADHVTGMFQLNGIAAGTYSVAIDGSGSYSDTTVTNVSVSTGASADVGTINLH
jgi:hypothetical protein